MKRIRVTLRKKSISKGRLSLYLDYYPPFFNSKSGNYSRREFLKLYLIAKPSSQIEKIVNAENLHRAELICSRRQNEVNKEFIYTPFELEELRKKEIGQKSFLEFFKKEASLRNGKNLALWESGIKHFEKFLKNRDLLFEEVDADLIEYFRSHLLKAESIRNIGNKLSQNTALTTLSDYWNEDSSSKDDQDTLADQEDQSMVHGNNPGRSANPALNSYRNSQSALGSFYNDDNNETQELRRQLDELKEKLADKEVPKSVTVDDQLALMEKSYQMAAKYLPTNTNNGEASPNTGSTAAASMQKEYFVAFAPAGKKAVSALYREPSDSVFLADWSADKNRNFYTPESAGQIAQPKNSVKACIQETQTIIGESGVRLRLLEPAQTPNRTIPQGTLLTAIAKFQGSRLQLKVSSIELGGNIIPVDITVYDLDGQQGLYIPYSPEMNAFTEMAGNMGQASGTSLMLTQSAGQQVAADLSRGVVQGISGYFSKKVKTLKVTLKAGYQVFLVSKK